MTLGYYRYLKRALNCGEGALLWRGSLLPLVREADPYPAHAVMQVLRVCRLYDGSAAEREQAPSPREVRLTWVDVIQHAIGQQRTQLNQLLNPQRQMAPRAIQVKRQITNHGIG